MKCDVPLPVRVEALAFGTPDQARLNVLFDALEFKSLRKEVGETAGAPAAASPVDPPKRARVPASALEIVTTEPPLTAVIERLRTAELVSLYAAASSEEPMRDHVVGLALAFADGAAYYLPFGHRYPGAPDQLDCAAALARLKPWLEHATARKALHDVKAALHLFANHGIQLAGAAESCQH